MTAMGGTDVIHGRVNATGRLESADPELLAMQSAAGGAADGPLVVPALARLARTAFRLGMTIARPVTVAGTAHDMALWVRLKPDADGVDIAIIDGGEGQARVEQPDQKLIAVHAALAGSGWSWQVDRNLQFRMVDVTAADAGHVLPQIGEPLAAYFRLEESPSPETGAQDAVLPMLSAVAARRPFAGQRASVRAVPGSDYLLAGMPLFDGLGRLTGYRGKADRVDADVPAPGANAGQTAPAVADQSSFPPSFSRTLDNALRQPLGRIVANANTISGQLQGPLRADYVSYASDIAAAGRHLLELVDDLTDLQAIERPDFTAAREEVDLADLGRRAAGLLKVRAAESGIELIVPADGIRLAAAAEYRRVLQILVNLIGNAVRYSPSGSTVWIDTAPDDQAGQVRITVSDQGRGIAPEDQERIFDRFERLTPEDSMGSGLGLYISRRLARAMQGDIIVDSAIGIGSRFTLVLPVWTQDI